MVGMTSFGQCLVGRCRVPALFQAQHWRAGAALWTELALVPILVELKA